MLICIAIAIEPWPASSQPVKDDKNKEEAVTEQNSEKKEKTSGIIPVVLPYYTPETSFALGFYVLGFANKIPGNTEHKPDEYTLYGTYTIKNQVSLGGSADKYFSGNKYKLSATMRFSRFPNIFWGIGPDTGENDDEDYTRISLETQAGFTMQVFRKLYIGPACSEKYDVMENREEDGLLKNADIAGRDGTTILGLGINIHWDARNSVFFPTRGYYIEMQAYVHRKEWGNEYNYNRAEIDTRYFYQLYKEHILGVQALAVLSNGKVPFQDMGTLGGNETLRGYYRGRYRDRIYTAFQTEYRYPIYTQWRLAGVVFGGLGQVSSTINEWSTHNIKMAFGAGLRFIADRSEHIAIRFDAGFDRELNPNFYFLMKEAF